LHQAIPRADRSADERGSSGNRRRSRMCRALVERSF
jgi:hypothetical protein